MRWFPPANTGPPLAKAEFRKRRERVRTRLVERQATLRDASRSALAVIAGMEGAGKGNTVNLLNEWMDPRFIRTRAFDRPSDEEARRPHFWRYWRVLPPHGELGLFLSAWYAEPLRRRAEGASDEWLSRRLEQIRSFEQTLVDEGVVITKFWLHLERDAQAERFRRLERDPLHRWRVTERDWQDWRSHERIAAAAEEILERTHTRRAPWVVVPAQDERRRSIEIAEGLERALAAVLDREHAKEVDKKRSRAPKGVPSAPADMGSAIARAAYRERLRRLQAKANRLHRLARERGVSLIVAFEGRDAAGKGGAIRRLVPAFDARSVEIVRIGPPSAEEQRHHYLWRFWRHLPAAGDVTIFDRSWYGRVLVERVEGLAGEEQWRRGYDEINDFERQLVEHGAVLVKLWLEIGRDEQARRFEERQRVRYKRWKLTDDDLRNRSRWREYDAAIRNAIDRTNTAHAPWTWVAANDKRSARLQALQAVVNALATGLGRGRRAPAPVVAEAVPRVAARD